MTDLYADYYGQYLHADRDCDELTGSTIWLHTDGHVLSRQTNADSRDKCPECCE